MLTVGAENWRYNKWSVLCEIISGVILAELANSNHSSTLGVATLGESILLLSLLKSMLISIMHNFMQNE